MSQLLIQNINLNGAMTDDQIVFSSLPLATEKRPNTQQNDIQHNDIQHNDAETEHK
jgi:hypothetical protein